MGPFGLFTGVEDFAALEDILSEHGAVPGSLIAVLQKTQDIYGYLSFEVMSHIARRTGISAAKVYGVAAFYANFG